MEGQAPPPCYEKKRPKQQGVPTRHVMFLFAGQADLAGLPHVTNVLVDNAARCYASFASEAAAVAAAETLRDRVSVDEATVKKQPIEAYFCTSSQDDERPLPVSSVSLSGVLGADAPPGLVLAADFVTQEEERELLAFFDQQRWDEDIKRRVQHYGFRFDYGSRSVNPAFAAVTPIPPVLSRLSDRLVAAGMPHAPDQITVNEYVAGIGIKPHVDTHSAFTDGIASLSLGAPIAMELKESAGERRFGVGLPPRSLLVMRGESRYAWTHGIAARKADVFDEGVLVPRQRRVSVTFRKVLSVGSECRCEWPACCDSQSRVAAAPASQVEREGVEGFYNRIADHFSATRHTPWPRVAEFVRGCARHSTLLDVGCGNGRHMLAGEQGAGVVMFGCDLIKRFVQICARERKLEVLRCDALHLPYRSSVFDSIMCVAVIHHLASEERRLRALEELVRVTALKGRVLVTVWAFEQQEAEKSKRHFEGQDVTVPWVLPAEHDPLRVAEVQQTDPKQRRRLPPASVDRYCHVFVKGELEELAARLPNVQLLDSYYDNANWAVVLRKIAL